MLLIDIRTLDIGQHEFNLECTAEDIDLKSDEMSDIRVDVQLHYDGKEALVVLTASAVARLLCDRTLEEFDSAVKGSYTVLFSPVKPGDDEEGDVRPFAATDEELDITDIVRDTLVLAIPIRKIAPGAESAEIKTTFGVSEEKNDVDPRWQALAALKEPASGADTPETE